MKMIIEHVNTGMQPPSPQFQSALHNVSHYLKNTLHREYTVSFQGQATSRPKFSRMDIKINFTTFTMSYIRHIGGPSQFAFHKLKVLASGYRESTKRVSLYKVSQACYLTVIQLASMTIHKDNCTCTTYLNC